MQGTRAGGGGGGGTSSSTDKQLDNCMLQSKIKLKQRKQLKKNGE